MSDAVGILSLPVTAPVIAPPHERTLAPGDPALVQIGSFLATALQSDCGTAWEALDAGRPDQPGAVDGTRAGANVVRRVLFSDPRLGYFEPADLPALFVWRALRADHRRFKADSYRRYWSVMVAWLPPPSEADPQRRERDTFGAAITSSLHRAIVFGRHKAWIRDVDLAAPTGLLADPIATDTAEQTITTFDGTLTLPIAPGRALQITTSPATGAYNTVDPILITGSLDGGGTHTDKVYLTDTDGGETVIGTWSFTEPTEIVIPAQLLTTGALTFGFYDSPDVKLGSLVQRAAGLTQFRLTSMSTAPVRVAQPNADPTVFAAIEATIETAEEIDIDLGEHAEALADPATAPGLDAAFAQGNNDPFNSFSL